MTKSSFTEKGERVNDVLDLVHIDVCGPMSISVRSGYHYFITFTDNLSRYGYIYLMKYKSESFKIFKRFHSEVEKQTEKSIRTLRSNQEDKYLSNKFLIYLQKNRILS